MILMVILILISGNILFESVKNNPITSPITTEISISQGEVGVQMLDEYGNFTYFEGELTVR